MSDTTKPQTTPTVRAKLSKFQLLLVWCGPAALILWFFTATSLNPLVLLTTMTGWLVLFGIIIVILAITVIGLTIDRKPKTSTD